MLTEQNLRILIVIPTYNNAGTLLDITLRALESGYDVLVFNDGSTDGAMFVLPAHDRLFIEGWESNQGKGAALLAAANKARNNGYTHIITMDADGQHDPAEARKFVAAIEDNPLSIVLGNRVFPETGVPGSSRFGRRFSNFWVWVCTGLRLKDTQSGYRAYPVALFERLSVSARHYNFEIEILVKGIWAGLDTQQTDVSVKYSEETIKASHFRAVADNALISITYTALVIRNFLPIPHKKYFETEERKKRKLSIKTPVKSLKRLLTEATSSQEIIISAMTGIFIGTLPLFFMHTVTIGFVATRLRLNRLIAINMQHFCAPPFVPVLALEAGYFILHGKLLWKMSDLGNIHTTRELWAVAGELFFEYVAGAIILAPLLALLCGLIIYLPVKALCRDIKT
ncbi:MAG: DUF2062 domain-containing protein [Nitrospirae bacterium YQR-1]